MQEGRVNYEWNTDHANLLDEYLKALSESCVKYFILRNYEGLPETNDSKDVDLVIEPGQYKKAAKILLRVFKNNNLDRYHISKFEKVRCIRGFRSSDFFSIHIDLIEGYVNKGFEIFDFNILYENTEIFKDYTVLNKKYDGAMLLLYKVINTKTLKEDYAKKIFEIYKEDPKAFSEILIDVLRVETATSIRSCIEENDFNSIVKVAKKISRKSKRVAFGKRPLRTLKQMISFACGKLYRIVWSPKKMRKMIAVEAPDGAGKTTFIDGISNEWAKLFLLDIKDMHIYHFRPTLFPNLGAVGEKAGVMKQDTDFTNPQRNKPANPISSFFRMCYYWLDYVLGGFIYLRRDVQFDRFSIFDRYIYDFIVDPVRSRINLPDWIRKMFAHIVYKPQLVFILTADEKIIYARKQELSQEEIKRQVKKFRNLKTMGKQFVELDASKNPSELVMEASRYALDKFTWDIKRGKV